jgi:hypothetical protein
VKNEKRLVRTLDFHCRSSWRRREDGTRKYVRKGEGEVSDRKM